MVQWYHVHTYVRTDYVDFVYTLYARASISACVELFVHNYYAKMQCPISIARQVACNLYQCV